MMAQPASATLKWAFFVTLSLTGGLILGSWGQAPVPLPAQTSPLRTPVVGAIYMYAHKPPVPPTPTATRIPDNEPPVTTLVVNGAKNRQSWYRTPLTLTFEATDNWLGLGATWYDFNDAAEWSDYEYYYPPISVTEEGRHRLTYYSKDKNDNAEQFQVATLNIDLTPPTTSHTLDGLYHSNGWYGSPVTINLTGQDNLSGLDHHQINRHDGHGWQTVTTTLMFSDTGHYTLTYRAIDRAGNVSPEKIIRLNVDTTPPTITHTLSGTQAADGSSTASVTVTLTAADVGAGLFQIFYRLDGDPAWRIYGGPFEVGGDGDHTLEYYAVDRANNAETFRVVALKIEGRKIYLPLVLKTGPGQN